LSTLNMEVSPSLSTVHIQGPWRHTSPKLTVGRKMAAGISFCATTANHNLLCGTLA
jgi:hypothetical protein